MFHFSRRALPLVLLVLLLAACSPGGGIGNSGDPSPTPRPSPTATAIPTTIPSPTQLATGRNVPLDSCPSTLSSESSCFTPNTMRIAYGVQSLINKGFTGKGQTVVDIVSFGSPTLQQDMDTFDAQFGLPAITIKILAPIGTKLFDPKNDDMVGWASETTLDVEIIHAIAPEAGITVLTSPVSETEGVIGLPEFRQLEQYTVDNKLGSIVSQSWGASEVSLQDQAGQQEIQKWTQLFQNATTQQKVTFLTGSGDNGATDYTDATLKKLSPTPTTGFPSNEPWVTSVGGTTLTREGTNISEIAWTDSGGGFSKFFKTPNFQQQLPPMVQSQLQGKRGVPDVAGAANPSATMVIYFDGQWTNIGGTSASAPLWAALVAIANQMAGHALGFINPALYKVGMSSTYAQDFYDITVGNNSNDTAHVQGFTATQGWDPITGLGSPNAEKLLPDLIAAMQ